jgi:hypothetical protein
MSIRMFIWIAAICLTVNADTISFLTSTCLRGMEKRTVQIVNGDTLTKSFSFSLNTIKITGITLANCCGTHFVSINRTNDTLIQLNAFDSGAICHCNCPYNFEINIPNCNENEYHILFKGIEDSFDTLLAKSVDVKRERIIRQNRIGIPQPNAYYNLFGQKLNTSRKQGIVIEANSNKVRCILMNSIFNK